MAVKRYLAEKGYEILCENYTAKTGEIDLIAKEGETIVFVEVKARESSAFGEPIEAVTPQKVRKIPLTAERYLLQNRLTNASVRFDVAEVLMGKIRYTQNAFTLNDAAKYRKY